MADFSKYAAPAAATPANNLSKYGTPVSASQPQQTQPLSDSIWARLAGGAEKVTNVLGLKGAVDTTGTLLANVITPITDPKAALTPGALDQPSLKRTIGAGTQIGATVAGLAATAPASVLANTALGTGLGASVAGGKALAEDQAPKTVAKQAAIGGALGGTVSGVTALASSFLGRVGDKIQYSVVKPTKADIEDGFTIDTIKKYKLGGSLTQVLKKTETQMDDLTRQLNEKLQAADAQVNLNEVFEATAQRLQGAKASSFGSNTSLESALGQLQREIASVGTDVPITEAQVIKRAAGHFGAWQYGMFDPDSTARQKVYNVFYNELKKAIENGSPAGVRDINRQLSELIPVMNAVIRRIPVAERNNALSLTDIIGLVGSSIDPRALGITLLNVLSKSGSVADILSRNQIRAAAPILGTGAATALPSASTTE